MLIAVDFDNEIEFEHQLDDGGVDETKELAKGTGALTQLLDDNVTEGEKALDVLDDVLHILVAEVLDTESTVRISKKCSLCEVRRGDDTVIMSVAAIACEWNLD